ncbi:MAG: hypothetical protein H6711_13270 [Myxococcales bacterium]|nr:hypothetical protein [Myxococcales bacterium]
MTVPRRASRPIEVDGHALRWWYRLPACGSADCPQDWPHVVIADAGRGGEIVTFAVPSGWGAVTPAHVAAAARRALAEGWRPGVGAGVRHVGPPPLDPGDPRRQGG